MIAFGTRRCDSHRDTLFDFVDRREIRPATAAALDHVTRCAACARELEVTALAIVGLRRLYDEVARLEPAGDAWDRLRSRVTRPVTPAYGLRSSILGAVMASSVVAVVGLQGVVFAGVLDRGSGASAITTRDAFEPTVRMVSLGNRTSAFSIVKRPVPDGDALGSSSGVAHAHVRRVSNA